MVITIIFMENLMEVIYEIYRRFPLLSLQRKTEKILVLKSETKNSKIVFFWK